MLGSPAYFKISLLDSLSIPLSMHLILNSGFINNSAEKAFHSEYSTDEILNKWNKKNLSLTFSRCFLFSTWHEFPFPNSIWNWADVTFFPELYAILVVLLYCFRNLEGSGGYTDPQCLLIIECYRETERM